MGAPQRDFAPVDGQITLHGLGFIQVKLEASQRLHIWHPALPRRRCFVHSPIHNHRFAFRSTVLVGVQINRRYEVTEAPAEIATHDVISHDGPRSPKGGRVSFVAGHATVQPLKDEHYMAGCSYVMQEGEYHETPNSGYVVTLMQKLSEGQVHANSLITSGHAFDQGFDRFQVPEHMLWAIVQDALRRAGGGRPDDTAGKAIEAAVMQAAGDRAMRGPY